MVRNKSERIFQSINNLFFLVVSLTMLAPLINLLAISLSSPLYVNNKLVLFWPREFNLSVYQKIIELPVLWQSMGVSITITIGGTLLTLFLGSTLAYAISRKQMKGRGTVLKGIVLTFIFTAPLIPTYLVVTSMGLKNTLWALMLPNALSAFYVLIMRTFFQGVSAEMFESAKIDGCSELGIYYRIVLPLSKAVMATIALFHAVYLWNGYFEALIYITNSNLFPMQIILRNMVVNDMAQKVLNNASVSETMMQTTPAMMKAGIILFATAPILFVYPFVQRYFVTGAMIGAVKE